MNLPLPDLKNINGYTVADDSRIGTKPRIFRRLLELTNSDEIYYPTTPVGASPIALAEACKDIGKKLILLSTQITDIDLAPALKKAKLLGADLRISHEEDFNLVEAWAKALAREQNGYIPDLTSEAALDCIAETAMALNVKPKTVVCATARGGITGSLQKAWPDAEHIAVVVLKLEDADYGTAQPIFTDTPYETPHPEKTPFPCNPFYEAKAWHIMNEVIAPSKDVLFWNPSGPN